MFIINIILTSLVVGYLASLKRKRFSVWLFIITAFLGALVGALISFGDSALYLKYPFFINIWTVMIIFSAVFTQVAVFADKGQIKRTMVTILVIILALVGFIYVDSLEGSNNENFEEELNFNEEIFFIDNEEWARHTDKTVGIQFEYRKDPSGYIITNPNNPTSLKTFVLHSALDFKNQRENSEGGPTINIEVFNPGPNVTPNDWIVSYENSNYVAGSPIKEIPLEDNVAISYEWDGLYSGETTVVARKGWVYTVSVMYNDKESQIYKDYETIISSLKILVFDYGMAPQNLIKDIPCDGPSDVCLNEIICEDGSKVEDIEVCGKVNVQCITAPCDPVKETFSNHCKAIEREAFDIKTGGCN